MYSMASWQLSKSSSWIRKYLREGGREGGRGRGGEREGEGEREGGGERGRGGERRREGGKERKKELKINHSHASSLPFMSLILLCQADGMAVVVGLATHLDGCLDIKRQILVRLGGEQNKGREVLADCAMDTHCHKLVELVNVLQFGVAVEEQGSVICIGLTFLVECLGSFGKGHHQHTPLIQSNPLPLDSRLNCGSSAHPKTADMRVKQVLRFPWYGEGDPLPFG